MTDTPELKPCPFCASRAETVSLFPTPTPGLTFVECKSCHAKGPRGGYNWAIGAWNLRCAQEASA